MWPLLLAGSAGVSGIFYFLLNYLWPGWYLDYLYRRSALYVGTLISSRVAKGQLFIDVFEEVAAKTPAKTFIIYEDKTFSYEFMDKKANQVARATVEVGVGPGSTVAVMIHNEPAFVWTYLGLMKAGCPVAFINFNLRGRSLAHCVKVTGASALLVGEGEDLVRAVGDISAEIPGVSVYLQGSTSQPKPSGFLSFELVLSRVSNESPGKTLRKDVDFASPCVYIFTSGTTGLPKPAIVSQARTLGSTISFDVFGMTSEDVLYQPLPLYHTSGWIGLINVATHGGTMVLKAKFSANQFWEDCRKYDVTVIQYVGELCRYLVSRPKSKKDGVHKIKLAFGNGLRMDIWEEFKTRFKIPKIIEVYAATEGNAAFINITGKTGAIGRSSPYLRQFTPCAFVKFDLESQSPQRNKQGWCIPIGTNEVGLLIAPVIPGVTPFAGYKDNPQATEKKLLRDVFKKGDVYVNSGDLMRVDSEYYLYFNDRVGDTFRWKGENVSTTEVSNLLTDLEFVQDANVYGVTMPGADGRAGMAAITLTDDGATCTPAMLAALSNHVTSVLPPYAQPKFIRVRPFLDMTSTFKQQKNALVNEGFEVTRIAEPLFYLNPSTKTYTPLDQHVFSQIMTGKIAF